MNAIRSIIFNIAYMLGSLVISLVFMWALLLPKKKCVEIVGTVYGGYIRFVARWIMGLHLKLEGLENLPTDQPYIIAAKHQSAFETLQIPFMKLLRFPVIIHKAELRKLPVWGLYLRGMGQIGINRGKGMEAMNMMTDGCRAALNDGRSIIIFPQGTRVAPGVKAPYKVGLAKLYKELHVPIVPLALNTGVFWGRNAFIKKPGVITFKFLPVIPADQPPLKAMEHLEQILERESDALVQSVGGPALQRE